MLEVHQRADRPLGKDSAARSRSRSSTGSACTTSAMTLCGRSGAMSGELVRLERLGGGDQLARIHRLDERFAHRIGNLDQDLAVAVRLDEVPDGEPLLERQRLEDVGDVGGCSRSSLARSSARCCLCTSLSTGSVLGHLLALDQAFRPSSASAASPPLRAGCTADPRLRAAPARRSRRLGQGICAAPMRAEMVAMRPAMIRAFRGRGRSAAGSAGSPRARPPAPR